MRAFRYIFLAVFCATSFARASIFDSGHLYFKSVTEQRDIPDGIVTAITQDHDGFVWLGSQQGAIRYDGYQFQLFKHDSKNTHSLAGNYIRTIWAGPENRIWFGTFSDGISVLDPKSQQFQHFDFSDRDKSSNSIRAILGEDPQRVWVATNGGLSFINPYSHKVVHISRIKGCDDIYNGNGARSLVLEERKALWLGTQTGLCRINLPTLSYQKDVLVGQTIDALTGQNINSMLLHSSGDLWLGTLQSGAARFNIKKQTLHWIEPGVNGLGHPWVVQIVADAHNHIWIGTLDGGISVFEPQSMKVLKQIRHDPSIPSSINQNNIGALFRDKANLMWIGTWGAGLNLFNPESDSIRSLRHSPYNDNSLQNARIRAIAETHQNEVWVGYSQVGVTIINSDDGQMRHIEPEPEKVGGLISGDILALHHSQDGEVWLGTRREGVLRYDPHTQQFVHYEQDANRGLKTVTSFALQEQQRLWIGSTRGVWYANLTEKQLHNVESYQGYDQIKDKIIYSIAWQAPDSLWVGTDDGLFHLSAQNQLIQEISERKGTANRLADNAINTLFVDTQNQLWVATENGLDQLQSWDGSHAYFLSVDEELNIEPAYTANIRPDDHGRIWHYKGLYDLPNKSSLSLNDNHGWDIGTIWLGAVEQTQDNTIIFGGNEGLLLVQANRFQSWQYQPPLAITHISVDNQTSWFDNQQTIALTAANRSFSVEFSSLDYTAPAQVKYAWRLHGFDDDWIYGDANNRRATYTNLPPGNYNLEIKGSNRSGVWTDNVINLKISQAPKWYENAWFLALMLLSAAAVIWWLLARRTSHLIRQKEKLDVLVQAQTEQLQEANIEKDRIMSIVAHDINNKISIGLGYLDLLKIETRSAEHKNLKDFVEQAIRAGQDCAELVKELRDYGQLSNESDQIQLKTANLNDTVKDIVKSHIPAAVAKNIHLRFHNTATTAWCQIHKVKFSRIMENLISNAIKFSHEGDHIDISLRIEGDQVVISVKDHGIGIPEQLKEQLFIAWSQVGRPGTKNEKSTGLGLYIVRKLVTQHQGTVWFESQEHKGAEFLVKLPLIN